MTKSLSPFFVYIVKMLGGGGVGGGSSSKRRHSTQSLSLLYRPSKPDIDLIRDHRRGSTTNTCGGTSSSTLGGASNEGSLTGSFLGLRRHSEVVSPSAAATTPIGGGGRQVRLSIDSGRVVQEFQFVKRGFFKSADQIYNKVFGSNHGSNSTTADAYAQHYGGTGRSRSKSFNALGGTTPAATAAASPGDFSSLGHAIETHLRNQLRRATFSNINDNSAAAASSATLQPNTQRPRSASTTLSSFPTIIVTASATTSAAPMGHHGSQPTTSLVRTEYENKTQVILEESSSANNNTSSSSTGIGGISLCGLVRDLLSRTFSVGVGFIRGHPPQQQQQHQQNQSNKRFFF